MSGDESTAGAEGDGSPNVRIRGIYTTAVTRLLLDTDAQVVGASEPIRERFDADFGDGPHDATVATTDDRQGVGVHGGADAIAAVEAVLDVGRDTFAWDDPTPPGAVFDARVTDTLGSGAVCDLGAAEGFLHYSATDASVEDGDTLRVQVRESAPPWTDRRAELGTGIRARSGFVTLTRGREGVTVDTRDDAAGRELAGMTDLLGVEVPDGWGIEWAHAATRAGMDGLEAALDGAADRAAALEDEDALEGGSSGNSTPDAGSAPGRVATPERGRWVWFGGESRAALDDARRRVAPTMPGHHRTKAASEAASAGVDLAEALCGSEFSDDADASDASDASGDSGPEFPFNVVTRQFGPTAGDTVAIGHGKPDGRAFTLGRGEVTDWDPDGTLEITRKMSGSGTYDALGTERTPGDTATTKVREGRWWYPTVYRSDGGESKGTYVNVCTPVECFPDSVRYVDLHVDVVKRPDGTVERVDDDELDAAVDAGHVPPAAAEKARSVAASLERALSE
ncbi:RNA-binding protein [Halobellus salinus]|uniref:Probable ribonuclease FAU-1 n=1 Tax=Halobellus salinus TaxID=931585 RepID=A0A830EJ34_9EURY|nr:DUF402 domain-containing protein [Halobellus salinus]GGI94001.1 RNA-binding protein [Halobellus salinus]SMP19414.1 RNA-binding protein AU-1 [Halobellus salinus]